MKIKNNKIAFIEETDINLFIPKNVDGIIDQWLYVDFAAIVPKTITVEEGNTTFYVQNNCLIERETKTLVIAGENAVIPNDGSVWDIIDCAFRGNRTLAKEFVIPEGVGLIGEMAFADTNIEKIFIPASVEYIGSMAFFSSNKSLKEIVVDGNSSHFCVESNCLIECEAVTIDDEYNLVTEKTKVVISIVNRNVREVVIPKGTVYISDGVFWLSDFDKIYIPKSVSGIRCGNFDIEERWGMDCSSDEEFIKFCERNNIVYGYYEND